MTKTDPSELMPGTLIAVGTPVFAGRKMVSVVWKPHMIIAMCDAVHDGKPWFTLSEGDVRWRWFNMLNVQILHTFD